MAIEQESNLPNRLLASTSLITAISDMEWLDQFHQMEQQGQQDLLIGNNSEAIGYYRRDVARFPLLSPIGERILFTLKKQSGEIQTLRESSEFKASFDQKDTAKVANLLSESTSLVDVAAYANLRLPFSLARNYYGTEFIDRVQEGNIGLLIGIEKFDIDQGFRFSTYAYHWVRQAISRYVADHSSPIRMPVHAYEFLNKALAKMRELYANADQAMSMKDMEDKLRQDPEMAGPRLTTLMNVITLGMRHPASLDRSVYSDDDRQLHELIPDPSEHTSNQAIELTTLSEIEAELKNILDNDEILIVRDRLMTANPITQAKIAEELGIHRQSVAALETRTIQKLRRSPVLRARARGNQPGDYVGKPTIIVPETTQEKIDQIQNTETKIIPHKIEIDDETYQQLQKKLTPREMVAVKDLFLTVPPLSIRDLAYKLNISRSNAYLLKDRVRAKLVANQNLREILYLEGDQPKSDQAVSEVKAAQVNRFLETQKLIKEAVGTPQWDQIPAEVKTLFNLTYLTLKNPSTEDLREITQQLSTMLGLSISEMVTMTGQWINFLQNKPNPTL